MKTTEVKSFADVDTSELKQPIICVFNKPDDYPDKYVARLFELLEEALVKFKKMLEDNSSLYDYVYNTVTVSDEDTEDDILRKITEGA